MDAAAPYALVPDAAGPGAGGAARRPPAWVSSGLCLGLAAAACGVWALGGPPPRLRAQELSLAEGAAKESIGQILWSLLVDPVGNFGKLRSDVLTSRVGGAVISAIAGYVLNAVTECKGQSSRQERDEQEIAKTSWDELDQQCKDRLGIRRTSTGWVYGSPDVGLLLRRYNKTKLTVAITSLVRLLAAHLLPCYVVFKICVHEPVPGLFSAFFRLVLCAYYVVYAVAAICLYFVSLCTARFTFVLTFGLPASAIFAYISRPPRQLQNMWIAAEVGEAANQFFTIALLVLCAPVLIAIGVGSSGFLRHVTSREWVEFMFSMDMGITLLAVVGLASAIYLGTPPFWFLVALFTSAPGLFFLPYNGDKF